MTMAYCVKAPAKVNLHLGIYEGRDERGYHRADSVMVALALHDEVTVSSAEGLIVEVEPALDVPPERTIIARSAKALAQAFDVPCDAHVRLVRNIPDKSGLGSASTDVAAALKGLCQLWGIDEHDARVHEIAAQAGADVPFFLDPVPSWLDGVGDRQRERFAPIPGVPVVLVRPTGGVSTVEAYREFDRLPSAPQSPEALCAALRTGDVRAVAASLFNNLEPAACRLEPEELTVVEWLRAQPGIMAAQVTGSGSCTFAICEGDAEAASIADAARERGWWSCATQTA